MFAIHGAVQIQIDRIRFMLRCGRNDLAGNALEGVPGDMGGRGGAGPEHRQQFGAFGHRANKAAHGDVDVPHRQDIGAPDQSGKGAAPHKIVIGGG